MTDHNYKNDNDKSDSDKTLDENLPPLRFGEMLQSVLAAALGVQSGKNRSRDFSRGKPAHFILLGAGFTVIFVILVLGVVQLVLHLAGL